ncbi:hypothetical protein [Spirosoma sp. KUDC1026]|uniref:hypothetical protein n=1 Tax=Spirosoma sp. KUDC1026 TaxID=2745947 RepID=UPI00159BA42A|nr:hypothetical protein [Spirosoma sp. KUDC1026]QKZ12479.1 hypothetical protein HU175_07490 [Spirosoma sp. KUDC1026]
MLLYPTLSGLENLNFFASQAGYYPCQQMLLSRVSLQADAYTRLLGGYSPLPTANLTANELEAIYLQTVKNETGTPTTNCIRVPA